MSDTMGFHELRPLVDALQDFVSACISVDSAIDYAGGKYSQEVRDVARDRLIHELARAFVRARA